MSHVHMYNRTYMCTNSLFHSLEISSTYRSAALLEWVQINILADGWCSNIRTMHSLNVRVLPQPNGPHTSEGICNNIKWIDQYIHSIQNTCMCAVYMDECDTNSKKNVFIIIE